MRQPRIIPEPATGYVLRVFLLILLSVSVLGMDHIVDDMESSIRYQEGGAAEG